MSFNFSPQPRFWPPPFPSSPLTPIVPSIANPALRNNLNFLTQNYWEGAVRINETNSLQGDTNFTGNFSKGVVSFWANNITAPGGGAYSDYIFSIIQNGQYDLSGGFGPPTLSVGYTQATVGQVYINLQCGAPSLFTVGLIQNPTGINPYFNIFAWGCPGNIGTDLNGNPLSVSSWHHYIASFDSQTQRIQMACDRGGGPAWGGGIMDTALGLDGFGNPAPKPIPGTATQKMWFGTTFGGGGNIANINTSDWSLMAPLLSSVDVAYCYLGISDTFFDLTKPGNLDYFVTPSLTPVNLGPAGAYVTPLTCLIMHTGNAANLFGIPIVDPWEANHPYGLGFMVSFNGKIYYSIFVGINVGNRPDISPGQWALLTPTTGFQFPYNAATGRLWGGAIDTAPTAPPIGV